LKDPTVSQMSHHI